MAAGHGEGKNLIYIISILTPYYQYVLSSLYMFYDALCNLRSTVTTSCKGSPASESWGLHNETTFIFLIPVISLGQKKLELTQWYRYLVDFRKCPTLQCIPFCRKPLMLGHHRQVSNIHYSLILNYSNLQRVLLHHKVRAEIHSAFWRSSNIVPAHLPDEYFIPTPTDLKAAQATLSARTQALINAPLQLRAVRETESKAKRDRWLEVLNIRPIIRLASWQL